MTGGTQNEYERGNRFRIRSDTGSRRDRHPGNPRFASRRVGRQGLAPSRRGRHGCFRFRVQGRCGSRGRGNAWSNHREPSAVDALTISSGVKRSRRARLGRQGSIEPPKSPKWRSHGIRPRERGASGRRCAPRKPSGNRPRRRAALASRRVPGDRLAQPIRAQDHLQRQAAHRSTLQRFPRLARLEERPAGPPMGGPRSKKRADLTLTQTWPRTGAGDFEPTQMGPGRRDEDHDFRHDLRSGPPHEMRPCDSVQRSSSSS
jgi:hypothetical protein